LGNLVNRSLAMLQRYRQGIVPAASDSLAEDMTQGVAAVTADLRRHRLQAALVGVWSLISRANQYVDQTAPFKLAKDPAQAARLDAVLYSLAETCRILAVLLWPFLPDTAGRIYAQLGLQGQPDRLQAAAWGGLHPGHKIGTPQPLFPRHDS
jgi:methionyl-tRNA synthetase